MQPHSDKPGGVQGSDDNAGRATVTAMFVLAPSDRLSVPFRKFVRVFFGNLRGRKERYVKAYIWWGEVFDPRFAV